MTGVNLFRSFLVNGFARRMAPSSFSYEDAIHKLNLLQSNKSSLEQIRKEIKNGMKCPNLANMENYLLRTGVTLPMLDELSVIHVAGTKGKGSTSAMCESILRHHGFKTGFYSSPHLVVVRERIRLCGRHVSEKQFAQYFHQVYDMLYKSQAYDGDMPKYFAFLTVLAFNVFLKERVDVAVIEVGIGGHVDYTNVLRKVQVVGITALGLDHTSILGNTLAEIAEAKAGIMKPGCVAYTCDQPPEAMAVLRRVAAECECPLKIAPDYKNYDNQVTLPANLDVYKTNASLAIQLAHAWMKFGKANLNLRNTLKSMTSGKILIQNGIKEIKAPFPINIDKSTNGVFDQLVTTVIPDETVAGLRECKWPGRYQVIHKDYATFYLDGAHTVESMEICANWFKSNSRSQQKFLIFSITGDRDATAILSHLKNMSFDQIFFVIPSAYKMNNEHSDNYYINEKKDLMAKCYRLDTIWRKLDNDEDLNRNKICVLECVSDALEVIQNTNIVNTPSVLVTGSLHLVGAALTILDRTLGED